MSIFASVLRTAYKLSGAKKAFGLPDEEIRKVIDKQNRNRGVFTPTDRKAHYETVTVHGFPCLIVREHPTPSKRAILYFFGGGMVIGPDKGDLPVMRKLMQDSGCDVWFPFYPLCTDHCITETYDMVYECYRRMIALYGGGVCDQARPHGHHARSLQRGFCIYGADPRKAGAHHHLRERLQMRLHHLRRQGPVSEKSPRIPRQSGVQKKQIAPGGRHMQTVLGILIPFLGTTAGAACVFFMKKSLGDLVQRSLAGFAAGVMVAASIWSLLIPAIEQSAALGKLAFFPAFAGFWLGVLFLLALDHLIPHLHVGSEQAEGPKSRLARTTMMVLAVTLHNIPEGMAVGVMYAGFLAGGTQITAASALALSIGIAIQNFPEGAIISMPLRAEGQKKGRAFLGGVLSGVVEPAGAVLTILAAQFIIPALPYLLSFAAGAMLYVVVEELIPELSQGAHSNTGTVFFAVGFSLMMVLDVALV